MDSMYQQLMALPLFAGVSHKKISDIIGRFPFHFLRFNDGEEIIGWGDKCTDLISVITGAVSTTTQSYDGKFRVCQTLDAPNTISPEFLFGRSTISPLTAIAKGPTGILKISKTDFMGILNSDPIFLFNYLNTLSMKAQLSVDGVMLLTSGNLEKRIAYWILALTQQGGTDVVLECKQRDMYAVFGVQRQSLISELDNLKAAGIIDYDNRHIAVKARRKLVDILTSTS